MTHDDFREECANVHRHMPGHGSASGYAAAQAMLACAYALLLIAKVIYHKQVR